MVKRVGAEVIMAEPDEIGGAVEPEAQQPGLKLLEAAVYIMGGLLVLMLLGLLAGIAWKLTHRSEVPPAQPADIAIPEGSNVEGVTLDGDRMAVHVVKGAQHEIIIIDTRKGAVISRVRLAPAQ